MQKFSIRTPAKINLFLKVLNRRTDGYHNIYSWFQTIDLYDQLFFQKSKAPGIRLSIKNANDLATDGNNLVVKAASLLFDKFALSGGLEIAMEKNIPIAAGLGGGSSDAAATIYGINRLFDLQLSPDQMSELALRIGSDVPFFFSSGQAEVTGRGDKINQIVLPRDYFIVLIVPKIAISTAESYRLLNLSLTRPDDNVKMPTCKTFEELIFMIGQIDNDFEKVHFNTITELEEIKRTLVNAGAAITRMSGSGPSMFGLFYDKPDEGYLDTLTGRGWNISIVHPIPCPLESH